jgi:hypothetical protein
MFAWLALCHTWALFHLSFNFCAYKREDNVVGMARFDTFTSSINFRASSLGSIAYIKSYNGKLSGLLLHVNWVLRQTCLISYCFLLLIA